MTACGRPDASSIPGIRPPDRSGAGQAGFSVIEISLILVVLAILTAMMVPVISSTLQEARLTSARGDLKAIGTALSDFLEDIGCKAVPQSGREGSRRLRADERGGPAGPLPPTPPPEPDPTDAALRHGGASPCSVGTICGGSLVELLVSAGDIPHFGPNAHHEWLEPVDHETVDFLDYYLVTNTPGNDPSRSYPTPDECGGSLSRPDLAAWRGAYISAPVGPDPWGNRYMVNVRFLEEGRLEDVVILSAGPDEEVDSPFWADGFSPGDDDLSVLFSAGRE